MNTIKVNRDQLLTKIKENRVKHINEYNESLVVYRKTIRDLLKRETARLESDANLDFDPKNVYLQKPNSFEKDYDNIITQLEWSCETVVELSATEVATYIEDNWSWKQNFSATNTFYKSLHA